MPESSENSPFKSSFVLIRNSVETARQTQKKDAVIDESLNMAVKFIDSLESFINILGPYGQSQLSDYCTGMVFGLEGVRVLKKVAMRIRDKNVMERLGQNMVVKKDKQKRVERLNKNKEGGMGNLGKKFLNKA